MLMHASVHSLNFDDNTAGTVFSFNVLAYQWGWNYYFPSDLLKLFREGPKRVGHSSVEIFNTAEPYSTLLLRFRAEHVRRLALQGGFVNRALPALSPLSLFTHNPSSDVVLEPAVFFPPLSLDLTTPSLALAEPLSQLETTNAPFFSTYAWLSSSPLFRTLAGLTQVTPTMSLALSPSLTFPLLFADSAHSTNVFAQTHLSSSLHLLPTRALQSLSLSGNRLYLVHRHLSAFVDPLVLGASHLFRGSAQPLFTSLGSLPLGLPSHHLSPSVIGPSNLVSSALSVGLGQPSADLIGWGALGFEDLGLTNTAAAKALLAGGANSARVHSHTPVGHSTLPTLLAHENFFLPFADLGSDWASAWLLSKGGSLHTRGLVSFFLSNTKDTSPLLAAQACLSGSTGASADFTLAEPSHLLGAQPSWSDFSHLQVFSSTPNLGGFDFAFFEPAFLPTFRPLFWVVFCCPDKGVEGEYIDVMRVYFPEIVVLGIPAFEHTSILAFGYEVYGSSVVDEEDEFLEIRPTLDLLEDLSEEGELSVVDPFGQDFTTAHGAVLSRTPTVSLDTSLFGALTPSGALVPAPKTFGFFSAVPTPSFYPLASYTSWCTWLLNSLFLAPTSIQSSPTTVFARFSSPQLQGGLDLFKPAKSLSPVFDPVDFLSGVTTLESSPWAMRQELFDWFVS
jgi:hypothetical protein